MLRLLYKPLPNFFCSRNCCLCAVHQSVKELRHAKKQRETGNKKTENKPSPNNPNRPKEQQTPETPQPSKKTFAATGETGETKSAQDRWETGLWSINARQLICPTSENGRGAVGSNAIATDGQARQRQGKPNKAKQTTKTDKPKTTQNRTSPSARWNEKSSETSAGLVKPWICMLPATDAGNACAAQRSCGGTTGPQCKGNSF